MNDDTLFFLIQATEYLRKAYSIEPNDIDLTEEGCEWALNEKLTPQEYIDTIAEKLDLTKLENWTLDKAIKELKRFS